MTNEGKAREIASLITSVYGVDIKQETHTYSAALQAMQWKDEQEIEFLQSLLFQASTPKALNTIIYNRIKLLKGE